MSELQLLIDGLGDTESALRDLAEQTTARPDDEILRLNMASIAKRRDDLIRRLDNSLRLSQNEICRYRVMRDWSNNYPVKAVAESLSAFQDLTTSIFDALRTKKPKERFTPLPENIEASQFNFAGAFAGSVVVTLAIPNDRLLAGQTVLDRTFEYIQKTLEADESADLQALAEEIGIASISKAYAWAQAAVAYNVDTSIQWGKTYEPDHKFVVTVAEAQNVKAIIESKSDERSDLIEMDCTLLGFDGPKSYFHVQPIGDDGEITGKLGPAISSSWTTDRPYRARLMKRSQIKYATGEEKIIWTLLELQPLSLPT
ncbi:MAG: hypothetical protein H6924_06025 [Alphaproteobacteria bacterium]|nr:hypothetical protein [Alphaproteobacteria bacterium]